MEARTVLPQTSSEAILKPQTAGQILVAAKGLHWAIAYFAESSREQVGAFRPTHETVERLRASMPLLFGALAHFLFDAFLKRRRTDEGLHRFEGGMELEKNDLGHVICFFNR